MPVASSSLQHTADIFDNAGCVVQHYAIRNSNGESRCEATAAKINGHPDYKDAPTIGCDYVSDCHLNPHLHGRAVLAGAVLLVAPSEANMAAPYFRSFYSSVRLVGSLPGCK